MHCLDRSFRIEVRLLLDIAAEEVTGRGTMLLTGSVIVGAAYESLNGRALESHSVGKDSPCKTGITAFVRLGGIKGGIGRMPTGFVKDNVVTGQGLEGIHQVLCRISLRH